LASGLIRIGAAGPISGGSAAFGLQFKEGVEQKVTLVRST
jgi:ABC-type branched-subunit amino acid transport system substrate-binding protein